MVHFSAHDFELISCSAKVGRDIHRLQQEFLAWLYDEQIHHPFWEYHEGEKFAVNYRSNALVYWLNRHRFAPLFHIINKPAHDNGVIEVSV